MCKVHKNPNAKYYGAWRNKRKISVESEVQIGE